MCEPDTIKPFPPGSFWKSDTELYKKWYKPTYNLHDVDTSTFDEATALRNTAELLYESTKKTYDEW